MTNVKTTTKVIGLLFVGAMYREITEELIRWKNLKRRKPLLVTGVRQCGKTYVLKELGEKHFENTCYIFDDLGMERSSEFGLETVFRVINVRYESGMSTIITTNLSLQELKFPPNLAHKRIYDRVLEMCVPIQFTGPNVRPVIHQKKMNVFTGIRNAENRCRYARYPHDSGSGAMF